MIEEPQFSKDAKNAIGYYGMLLFMTCGVVILFGGMICPFFWKTIDDKLEMWAKTKFEKNPGGKSYEDILASYRGMAIIGMIFWFLSSWIVFIWMQISYNLH